MSLTVTCEIQELCYLPVGLDKGHSACNVISVRLILLPSNIYPNPCSVFVFTRVL
jgi:hypothetical protein